MRWFLTTLLIPAAWLGACHRARDVAVTGDPGTMLRHCVTAGVRQAGFRIVRQDSVSLFASATSSAPSTLGDSSTARRVEEVRVVFLTEGFGTQVSARVLERGRTSRIRQEPPSMRLRTLDDNLRKACLPAG